MTQLRKDIVSGDWIIIASGRAKRPHEEGNNLPLRVIAPENECPFEDVEKSGNEAPHAYYPHKRNWRIQVIKNKYPVVSHMSTCPTGSYEGPYETLRAEGHHELIITKDHRKNFAHLDGSDALLVFEAMKDRYYTIARDECVRYISLFHNWGPYAGASIFHPHYQVIALPVVPPDVYHSLQGSSLFFKEKNACVHCHVIAWEKKKGERILFENEEVIALAPFFSRNPYEVRIFPKKHLSCFEESSQKVLHAIIFALQELLRRIEQKLHDPDYNFFIHTSPIKDKDSFHYYHWHIEIVPKINIRAGFELGTGIDINPVDPNEATALLR